VKGLFVLLLVLALLAGLAYAGGYYLYGERINDILLATEAKLRAKALRDGSEPDAAGEPVQAENAEPAAPPAMQSVQFTDQQQRFTAIFPGPVSEFDVIAGEIDPAVVRQQWTYAAVGQDIVAQVTILDWQDAFLPEARKLYDDPASLIFEPSGRKLVDMLMGEQAEIQLVRDFEAFGRYSIELTGYLPNGEGGWHRAVIWIMPAPGNLVVVILRAAGDKLLLGGEATQFNASFALLDPMQIKDSSGAVMKHAHKPLVLRNLPEAEPADEPGTEQDASEPVEPPSAPQPESANPDAAPATPPRSGLEAPTPPLAETAPTR
jgi:hypothetical protein